MWPFFFLQPSKLKYPIGSTLIIILVDIAPICDIYSKLIVRSIAAIWILPIYISVIKCVCKRTDSQMIKRSFTEM